MFILFINVNTGLNVFLQFTLKGLSFLNFPGALSISARNIGQRA